MENTEKTHTHNLITMLVWGAPVLYPYGHFEDHSCDQRAELSFHVHSFTTKHFTI